MNNRTAALWLLVLTGACALFFLNSESSARQRIAAKSPAASFAEPQPTLAGREDRERDCMEARVKALSDSVKIVTDCKLALSARRCEPTILCSGCSGALLD